MRVLHVIPSLDAGDGGPSKVVVEICRALRKAGEDAEIVSTGNPPDLPQDIPIGMFPRQGRLDYKFSPELARWLDAEVARYDLLHVHAVFNHSTHAAARAAARRGVPYIIRPLGTLNRSYALRQSRWRKAAYMRLFARRELNRAAALHCTSQAEKEDMIGLRLRAPAVVIPLGLHGDEFLSLPLRRSGAPPCIAYLGRIHPKKGFDLLFPALEEIQGKHAFRLVVAGSGDADYLAALKDEASRRGLADRTEWPGHVVGEKKLALLAAADLFVLPSYSENFGIAVAEAMACGIPVVVSDQVDLWPDIAEYDAGPVVKCQVDELAAAIARLLSGRELREKMGENGRRLVRERFDWRAITPKLQELYRSIGKS